jgi:hypothetical protein
MDAGVGQSAACPPFRGQSSVLRHPGLDYLGTDECWLVRHGQAQEIRHQPKRTALQKTSMQRQEIEKVEGQKPTSGLRLGD